MAFFSLSLSLFRNRFLCLLGERDLRRIEDGGFPKSSWFETKVPKAKEEKFVGPNWFIFSVRVGFLGVAKERRKRRNGTGWRFCYYFSLVALVGVGHREKERKLCCASAGGCSQLLHFSSFRFQMQDNHFGKKQKQNNNIILA